MTTPVNVRPWGYASPLLTAFDEVFLDRWQEFNKAVAATALYDPDTVPAQFLQEMIKTFAGVDLYQEVLGESYNREVYRNALELNLLRGTDGALNLYNTLAQIGYHYRINRVDSNGNAVAYPTPGIPNTVDFFVTNRTGRTWTAEEIAAIARAYQVLIPRTLTINLPINIASEGVGNLALMSISRPVAIWDGGFTQPYVPFVGETAFGQSFDQEAFE